MSRATLPPVEDDFARALLGSAEADAPSHAAYVKAAAALGLGVGLGAGASLPVAAPTAVAVGAGAAGVARVARWASSLGAKLILASVSGALFVGAGALLLRSHAPDKLVSPTGRVSAAQAASVAQAAIAPTPAKPAATDALSVAPLVPAPVAPLVAGSVAAKPAEQSLSSAAPHPLAPAAVAPSARRVARALPAHASSGSSLAEEVQSLDRARVALAAGDSSAALREIARYRAAWPGGVFLTEASVLEVEALAARGERSLAATRAADFVAAHPDSPQADRLRALIPSKNR